MVYADNPQIFNVTPSEFDPKATFRQVVLTVRTVVKEHSVSYEFVSEAENGVTIPFNISSALHAALAADYVRDFGSDGVGDLRTYNARFFVSYHVSQMINGNMVHGGEHSLLPEENQEQGVLFRAGGLPDSYLRMGIEPLIPSLKPRTGEIVRLKSKIYLGEDYWVPESLGDFSIEFEDDDEEVFYSRSLYVVDDPERVEFVFLNSFCEFESVSVVPFESMDYSIERSRKSLVSSPSMIPNAEFIASPARPYAQFSLASGFVSREWADWFCSEFLTASRHWIAVRRPDGSRSFLPCLVESDGTNSVYDRAKGELLSVNFRATLSISGPVSLH